MELATAWQPKGSYRLLMVHAGKAYATASKKADEKLTDLREWIVDARAAGMTVTDIAELTGLSRPAVYRALRGKGD